MKHLWKQLVQPHVDYCSQLWIPTNGSKLEALESLQRNFTVRIPSVRHLDYWSRLSELQLLSQQRRLERYRIIYLWKIIAGIMPNCGVEARNNDRLGRMCVVPELKTRAAASVKSLRENSFQIHGPKLFNCLPIHIRNMKNCGVDEFKSELDKILEIIPDQPNVPGMYTPTACDLYSGKPSNSLIDQIRITEVPSKPKRRIGV